MADRAFITKSGIRTMAVAAKQTRGTKRTCQNDDCGARFYDLNRDPIQCPICDSDYRIASSPLAMSAIIAEEKQARAKAKKDLVPKAEGEEDVVVESEDALDNVEVADDDAPADDETFLEEEEEEGGDLSNVIGGPVVEGEGEV
jgi:uncharacterized protein (TIGR02300 family)